MGDWVNGKREGKGRCTWSDGVYEGEWKDDKWNGQGIHYIGGDENSDCDVYEGEFVNGHREGHGTYTWRSSGSSAEGEWKNGKRNGPGNYKWKDGAVWVGNYVDSKWHGHGKMTYASGNTLEGEWVNGEKHGILTYTYTDGTVVYEQWNNGTLVEKRDKDGNLITN